MGIKNLPRRLNEAGKIKIGKKGKETKSKEGVVFRLPVRFDHFVVTTTEKNDEGDYIVDLELMDRVKESGRGLVNANGDLVGIPIRLMYDSTELNFPTRYACYVSGKLACYGDGEAAFSRVDDYKQAKPCPCPRLEPDYDEKDKCKPNGTLTCVIDEACLFGQVHRFRTTSFNSITGIYNGIELIKTATNGRIAGLPLMLVINNKSTAIPGSGEQTTIQVVSICYHGDMSALRNDALKFLTENQQYLLGMEEIEKNAYSIGLAEVVTPDEEKEFLDEFMPDARNISADAVSTSSPASLDTVSGEVEEETVSVEDTQGPGQEESKGVQDVGPQVVSPEPTDAGAQLIEVVKQDIGDFDLYTRLSEEKNLDDALSLAKRLQKKSLILYLREFFPGVTIPENQNKPVYLDLVLEHLKKKLTPGSTDLTVSREGMGRVDNPDNHPLIVELQGTAEQADCVKKMREFFKDTPINGTLPKPELIKYASYLLTKSASAPRFKWDDSGQLTKDQKKRIALLKNSLKFTSDSWTKYISKFFLNQEGQPATSALELSTKQADSLITLLEDEPPF